VSRRAVFLDRDGTLNALVPDSQSGLPESPLRLVDVQLLPGVADALLTIAASGWLLVGVSNQPAAAKGTVGIEDLLSIHGRVVDLLAVEGVSFADFRLCLHHPQGVVPELTRDCDCRKPKPGMLLDAGAALGIDLSVSLMIGDTDADVLAGRSAGCRTGLLEPEGSRHKRGGDADPDRTFPDLPAAVGWVLSQSAVE
jgi:D-glycero-D-manno-heptose 1,7-bisphosphate phosphatase